MGLSGGHKFVRQNSLAIVKSFFERDRQTDRHRHRHIDTVKQKLRKTQRKRERQIKKEREKAVCGGWGGVEAMLIDYFLLEYH